MNGNGNEILLRSQEMNYNFMNDIKYIETVHFAKKNVFSNVILKINHTIRDIVTFVSLEWI